MKEVDNIPESDGNIKFCKLDIKDGYWRMYVECIIDWNFVCVLPPNPSNIDSVFETVLLLALQMG